MSAPANSSANSGSKRPCPGAVDDSDRRVHPRHFHFGPNPAAATASASGGAAAAESDRPPPAARLYRHALESIFGWLNQRELVKALQVSKVLDWLAAVESMASLQLTVEQPSVPLRVIADSLWAATSPSSANLERMPQSPPTRCSSWLGPCRSCAC